VLLVALHELFNNAGPKAALEGSPSVANTPNGTSPDEAAVQLVKNAAARRLPAAVLDDSMLDRLFDICK
jgi:hypothetical protein